MRFVLAMVLAGLAGLPLSVGAQAASEDSLSSWQVEAKPAPEEPALELKLDDDSVKITPGAYRARTVEEMEMERRVRRARIGLGLTAVPIFAGTVVALGSSFSNYSLPESTPEEAEQDRRATIVGTVVAVCGTVSMIATGILLGHRKQKLRELKQAHYGNPRRVQWDLERSRLVF